MGHFEICSTNSSSDHILGRHGGHDAQDLVPAHEIIVREMQNRGRAEAVPMDLREVNLDAPLKVQITNGDPGFPRTP